MTNSTKRSLSYISFLLFVSIFSSCNHYFYTPPESNLLMLSEKGDIKVSAGAGFSALDEGSYNIQAGYSPIKHLGIAGNYFQVGKVESPSAAPDDRVFSYAFEGTIGAYFTKKIKTEVRKGEENSLVKNNKLTFDLYTGYGQIDLDRAFLRGGKADFNSQYYFLQGGVHFQSRILGLSYTLRGVQLDFTDGKVIGQVSENNLLEIHDLENDPFAFLESSVRLRVGGQKLKCFVGRNWMTSPFKGKQLKYANSSWHIGVIVDVHEFFKKKQQQ